MLWIQTNQFVTHQVISNPWSSQNNNETKQIKINLGCSTVFENYRKVSFNLASEASYVYILVDKSLMKMPKIVNFGEFSKTWILRSNSVTSQVTFKRKMPKLTKLNVTFWVIFKHCAQIKVQNKFCFSLFIEKCV